MFLIAILITFSFLPYGYSIVCCLRFVAFKHILILHVNESFVYKKRGEMPLSPMDIYEAEYKAYEALLANYEQPLAENPEMARWLAKPTPPTLPSQQHWSMRNVVTGARRNWKRG
jgi:hypothetical protein